MDTLLGVEMRTLGRHLAELAAQDRYARELNREQLIDALIEVTACLSIYRTYIRSMDLPAHATNYIEDAITEARRKAPGISSACFDFVREVLLILSPPHVLVDQREARLAFVLRWQQFTGPIVAKGLEDTALYVYHPLLSLNEVGGNPCPSDAAPLEEFCAFLANRQTHWPGSLNGSSTHDTKRSEDIRARLNVLSEMPSEWKDHLELWANQNAPLKEQVKGEAVPDRNEEYFLYQTLLGVWPLDREACSTLLRRVQDHIIKATREAMVHTRWTRPNQPHEDALVQFVAKILSPDNRAFLEDFRQFQKKIAYFGMVNGLSQTLLKIAAPGVPDFYQGSELWDLRLVDPDNRGPIDFHKRAAALDSIAQADSIQAVQALVENWHDGCIKLYLIWNATRFRRDHADLLRDGEFIPLQTAGSFSRNVAAFLRRKESSRALAVVPRWLSQVPAKENGDFNWGDTTVILPSDSPAEWKNILTPTKVASKNETTERHVMVDDLFRQFPVALFHAEGN
jgi:(1->4)-alpha-D-glucan 1-alpha-D-glucosylmutase